MAGSSRRTTARWGRDWGMAGFLHKVAILPLADRDPPREDGPMTQIAPERTDGRSLHWAWVVAPAAFLTLVGSAAFRSVPGVLMDPLHTEFGWSHGTISFAIAVNMVLFGLIS